MKYLYSLLFACLAIQASAQDKIITIDSDTILCKILEKGTSEVSYVLFSNLSGPAQSKSYTEIHKIIMQSGVVTEYTALTKPKTPATKTRTINGVQESEPNKKTNTSWNRHSIRGELAVSSGVGFYGGMGLEALLSYSFSITERKAIRVSGSAGYGTWINTVRGWYVDAEYISYNAAVCYHYTWYNGSRVKLHSGLGIGYIFHDAYVLDIRENTFYTSSLPTITPEEARRQTLVAATESIMPDIEFIGADFYLGDHFSINTRLGFGPAGLANLGIGYSF